MPQAAGSHALVLVFKRPKQAEHWRDYITHHQQWWTGLRQIKDSPVLKVRNLLLVAVIPFPGQSALVHRDLLEQLEESGLIRNRWIHEVSNDIRKRAKNREHLDLVDLARVGIYTSADSCCIAV